MAYELAQEDLEPLLLGAAFFGCGGGGTIEPRGISPRTVRVGRPCWK